MSQLCTQTKAHHQHLLSISYFTGMLPLPWLHPPCPTHPPPSLLFARQSFFHVSFPTPSLQWSQQGPWLKPAPLLPKQSFPFKACLFLKATWEGFHFSYKLLPHPEIHHKKWKERAAEPQPSFLLGNLSAAEPRAPGMAVSQLMDAVLSPISSISTSLWTKDYHLCNL